MRKETIDYQKIIKKYKHKHPDKLSGDEIIELEVAKMEQCLAFGKVFGMICKWIILLAFDFLLIYIIITFLSLSKTLQ